MIEPDVESGGRDLEPRAEEHPESVPQPSGPRGQDGVLIGTGAWSYSTLSRLEGWRCR